MKKQLLTSILLFSFCVLSAQNLWRNATQQEAARSGTKPRTSTPKTASYFQLDLNAFKQTLASAPMRGNVSNLVIPLPDYTGNIQTFRIWEAPVMHPELAAKHPDIKSYVGQGIENPTSVVRFSVTLFGLHAMTLAANNGTFYIDPYSNDGTYYISYAKQGLTSSHSFECHTIDSEPALRIEDIDLIPQDNGVHRTYRTGIVTTVEYGNFHIAAAGLQSGTLAQKKACVLAAVTVTVTRVNSMFERDLSVFMQLIPNQEDVIFIDTDNLTDDDVGALIGETQETLDEIIGDANYDFGHGVGTSGGGLGGGTPCLSGQKAFGATGLGSPVGDPFDIDYVAHEMGHQFGAAHTFNNSCGGNRSDDWAYEPGSGSSIMAYAGICSPNIQMNSNAQFFAGSIIQIRNTINGSGGSCITPTSNNNSRPSANAGIDYTIPKGTAFILTGSAADADNDALSYMWEQYDNEISVQPPSPTSTNGPNFKPQIISTSPVRYMPQLSDVLANNLAPTWEVIPTVGREMNFAFTVRDNKPDGGESITDFMKVTVSNTAGPFVVDSPNTNVNWLAASNQTVTWNVAGTTGNGVNATGVDILLSINGGLNFNYVLAENVPNDGFETVTVPNTPGQANRIMVRGHENIFYDVSNENFTILSGGETFLFDLESTQTVYVCQGASSTFDFTYTPLNGFGGTTSFVISGTPTNANATISPSPISDTGIVQLEISSTQNTPPGGYPVTITATSGSIIKTATVYVNVLGSTFTGVILETPTDQSDIVPLTTTLEWTADSNASSYQVEVSTTEDFSTLVVQAVATTNSFEISGLIESTLYYWRVKPQNAGCEGVFSPISQFTTGDIVCDAYTPNAVPISIPANEETTVFGYLPITQTFTIQKTTVALDISHTWVNDLAVKLISPSGTEVVLFSHICGAEDDVLAVFDDEGAMLNCSPVTPVISGTFAPETPLSVLNGEPTNGQWTLEIYDEFPEDGGAVNSWTLNLCSIQSALSTPQIMAKDFLLYPNPSDGSFTIQLSNFSGRLDIRVHDVRGRTIYENKAEALGGIMMHSVSLDAQAGMYFVELRSQGQRIVKKMMIR